MENSVTISLTLFVAQYILWALSLIAAFIGGVTFWAKHAKYNGVSSPRETAQTALPQPQKQERRYRSA